MEDFDALVAELVKSDGQTPEAPKEEKFKLHLGGRDYTFDTQQEAERAVETHMARLEEQARLAQSVATPPPAPAPAPAAKEGEVPEWTRKFVAALEQGDAKSVAKMLLRDGVFDGKIEDPSAVLTESLLRTAQMDRQSSVQQFLSAHPELVNNNAASSAVEQARQFLNLPATPDGFEAAHAYAERKGLIQSQPIGTGQPTRTGAPALPSSRGASTGSGQPQSDADWEAFYNSRSEAELEKLMKAAYSTRA